VLLEADLCVGATADVCDLVVEGDESHLVPVPERQVAASEREPRTNRPRVRAVVEQRERIERRLGRGRGERVRRSRVAYGIRGEWSRRRREWCRRSHGASSPPDREEGVSEL